ncbi:SRPBCC domain-containing protein [Caenimonas koreensis DSM 17982]|uniref:SRPBCC domain-containing protein n=1 Tax=Caenimonas koreensis DSM 17982 TaxID=1121255 RepID=A0A844ARA1_9BURK|nr:SRPBCC domain-containing protein [Caenimonas koreensis]MRD46870.1 SRPBCC domain-containing protein [Caenimonas koreensis DSM 17982]
MADAMTVRVTHRYQLPAQRLFDAWLTPSVAGRFLFATRTGTVLHCEIDAREGGQFTVTDRRPTADGDESFFDAQHRGTYVEIDPPSRLVFDFAVEPYADEATRVTLDFVTLGANLCEIVLTHQLPDNETARLYEERTRQGWANMLAQLDKVLNTRTWGGLKG